MNDYIKYAKVYTDDFMENLFKEGNTDTIGNLGDNHEVFFFAVEKNYITMLNILFMYEKHGLGETFYYLCKGGSIDTVKQFLQCFPNHDEYINRGFGGACSGGHIDIINLLINKGANNYSEGLARACKRGHIETVKLLLNRVNFYDIDIESLFTNACIGGNLDIINLLINKNVSPIYGFYGACYGGHVDVLDLVMEKITCTDLNILNLRYKTGIIFSYRRGHTNIIKLLQKKMQKVMVLPDEDFPCSNRKAKYYKNSHYDPNYHRENFMFHSIIYWTLLYQRNTKYNKIIHDDLFFYLLKIMYF